MDIWLILFAVVLALICYFIPHIWLKSGNISLINSIPTFCTSVGVFFSFFALFWVLGVQGVKGYELDVIIRQLSSKFLFSIIGVLSSILWNWQIKKKQGEEELKLSQNNWKQKDPQELLYDLLQTNLAFKGKFEAYAQSQQKTLQVMQLFNSSINEIKEQFKVLNTHSVNIKNAIEKSATTQSEEATVQRKTLVGIHNFMQSAGDSLKDLLDDLKNQLENNIKAMGTDAAEKAAELHRVFEDFLKKQTSEMSEKMALDIKEVHEKIHPALNSISEVTSNNANELKQTLGEINAVLGELKLSLTTQINQQFEATGNNLHEINNNLQASIDSILKEKEEQIRKTFENLEILRGRSETVLNETTQKFAASVEQYTHIQHNNEEVIKRLETQIESIDNLQETSQNQIDYWNNQVEDMKNLKNKVADIANTIEQLDSLNEKLGLLSSHKN